MKGFDHSQETINRREAKCEDTRRHRHLRQGVVSDAVKLSEPPVSVRII